MDSASTIKLILIEDEDAIRDLYKRQLDLASLPTDAFANGKDGLAALSQNSYAMLLLDIMLPDLNGLQILKEVKSNEKTKNIPVVLLTNLGQDAIIKEGFQLGADGYLVKSAYTPDQIIQEIRNILARKGSNAGAQQSATQATPAPQQPPIQAQPIPNPLPPTPQPVTPQQAPASQNVTPASVQQTEVFTPVAPSPPPVDNNSEKT